MLFEIKYFLSKNYSTGNDDEHEEVDGSLLVGQKKIFGYDEDNSNYGWNDCQIFPAFYKGDKAFLIRKIWRPISPYEGHGCHEEIVSFLKGATLLIEKGAYEHLFKKD